MLPLTSILRKAKYGMNRRSVEVYHLLLKRGNLLLKRGKNAEMWDIALLNGKSIKEIKTMNTDSLVFWIAMKSKKRSWEPSLARSPFDGLS